MSVKDALRIGVWSLQFIFFVACLHIALLSLPLEFSHSSHQEADFVAVEFCDRGDTMNVPDEVFGCTQKGFESDLAVASTEHVAIGSYDHLDEPGRCPILTKQAPEDRLKVIADLDKPKLSGAVLANLIGFTDRRLGGIHCIPRALTTASVESAWKAVSNLANNSPGIVGMSFTLVIGSRIRFATGVEDYITGFYHHQPSSWLGLSSLRTRHLTSSMLDFSTLQTFFQLPRTSILSWRARRIRQSPRLFQIQAQATAPSG